jgi:hypothetical protein
MFGTIFTLNSLSVVLNSAAEGRNDEHINEF